MQKIRTHGSSSCVRLHVYVQMYKMLLDFGCELVPLESLTAAPTFLHLLVVLGTVGHN